MSLIIIKEKISKLDFNRQISNNGKYTFIKLLCTIIVFLLFFLSKSNSYAYLATDYVELEVTYKKDNGESCSTGTDCFSNNCIDNYCCNTSCSGDCESCDASGLEGTCTTKSSGDNTECSDCYYCDGSNTTCQLVGIGTDPYDDCDVSCASTCELNTGLCDGAGACDSTYCSAQEACSGGSCSGSNYCNAAYASCSCEGDDCYDDSGSAYNCQAQCDGGGTCDYAVNCSEILPYQTSLSFGSGLNLSGLKLDYFGPALEPSTEPTEVSCPADREFPDTEQYSCYNTTSSISCLSVDYPLQDADFSYAGPRYVKNSVTVIDYMTGLEWQLHGHGSSNGYTLPSSVGDCATGGDYASNACEYSWQNALKYCDGLSLGGNSDWRLPDIKELHSILSIQSATPLIDSEYFSNTRSVTYFSSTTNIGFPSWAIGLSFGSSGNITTFNTKTSTYAVRCVRGDTTVSGSCTLASDGKLPDSGQTQCYDASSIISCSDADYPGQDGDYSYNTLSYTQNTYTVDDNVTGLTWQRYGHGSSDGYTIPTSSGDCASGGSYSGGYCTYNWQEALKYCEGLSLDGNTSWKLPNYNELVSIFDYSTDDPPISSEFGSTNTSGDYYASSSSSYSGTMAYGTRWDTAVSSNQRNKSTEEFYVRCVAYDPCEGETTKSYGGETYDLVGIYDQCWFAENLNVSDGNEDGDCTFTKYCYSGNPDLCLERGGLYTWPDIMCGSSGCNGTGESQPECSSPVQGICPTGWHIPSQYEWIKLGREMALLIGNTVPNGSFPYDDTTDGVGYYGQDTSTAEGEGSALASDESAWIDDALDNSGAGDNDFGVSGLNLLPGGHTFMGYEGWGSVGAYWSSTDISGTAWHTQVRNDATTIGILMAIWSEDKQSIRCIKD